jgi:hypothetical protein
MEVPLAEIALWGNRDLPFGPIAWGARLCPAPAGGAVDDATALTGARAVAEGVCRAVAGAAFKPHRLRGGCEGGLMQPVAAGFEANTEAMVVSARRAVPGDRRLGSAGCGRT